ncbi:MAG: carboxylating nicotinate-nucleotide diphosphorylase [Gammaproteobacteria bacterium]|nr:carboxylating nicotinate-nucleotide diphosphorylase [Gammaproteobacteria bacterium]
MPRLPKDIQPTVRRALEEDIGRGDATAAMIPTGLEASAMIICREEAILCGSPWFDEVFRQLGGNGVTVNWMANEGDAIAPDQMLCTLEGSAATLLSGERTALNFLQALSGTATLARRYAEAVSGTATKILDTRKTIPGLRRAQKYAVKCGGCTNHRMGLYDGILIKENHIHAVGGIETAVHQARESHPKLTVEVEVENLDELRQAIQANADIVMLDNFILEGMEKAVAITAGRVKLEVSGNVDFDQVRSIARTGVDFISVGALTKNVQAVDLSMRFIPD